MSKLEELVGSMSVAQLADLAGVDVESLVATVLRGKAPRAKSSQPKAKAVSKAPAIASAASKAATGAAPNTRTKEGRAAFDTAIMTFLSTCDEPVRAVAVRQAVGGTSAQVRTRINALIDEGKLEFSGQASGTRYWTKN